MSPTFQVPLIVLGERFSSNRNNAHYKDKDDCVDSNVYAVRVPASSHARATRRKCGQVESHERVGYVIWTWDKCICFKTNTDQLPCSRADNTPRNC